MRTLVVSPKLARNIADLVVVKMAVRKQRQAQALSDRMDGYEVMFQKTMAAMFQFQMEDTLTWLTARKAAIHNLPFDQLLARRAEWDRRLRESTHIVYAKVVDDTLHSAADQVGVGLSFDVYNDRRDYYIGDKLHKVVGINDTTLNDLRDMFAIEIERGTSIPEMGRKVRGLFEDANTARGLTIARTEVVSSSNGAAYMAYVQSGVVDGLKWQTSRDGRERTSHGEMNNIATPIGRPFSVPRYGKDPGIDAMKYPGDPTGSAENVINCRCSLLPLIDEVERQAQRQEQDNPPPPATTPTLKAPRAKTNREAVELLREQGYKMGRVDAQILLEGGDEARDVANTVLAETAYLTERYPGISEATSDGLGSVRITTAARESGLRKMFGFTYVERPDGTGWKLNANYMSLRRNLYTTDKGPFDDAVEDSVVAVTKERWATYSMPAAVAQRYAPAGPLFRHEFGHQIHGHFFDRPSPLTPGLTVDQELKRMHKEAVKKFAPVERGLAQGVSQYSSHAKTKAARRYREFFAEAFTVYTSPKFKPGTLNTATGTNIEALLAALLKG